LEIKGFFENHIKREEFVIQIPPFIFKSIEGLKETNSLYPSKI